MSYHCLQKQQKVVEGVERETASYGGGGDAETLPVLKVPRQCPLARLVKVKRWEVKSVKLWGVE
jgi:hypothetical protein